MKSGGAICGSFVIFGGLSVLFYKPWRTRIDRKREKRLQQEQLQDDKAIGIPPQLRLSPDSDRSQGDRESPANTNNVNGNPDDLEAIPTFGGCHAPSSQLGETE